MSDTDQRFAPPQAHVADLASDGVVLAERGTRLLAAVVDALVVGGLIWAAATVPPLKAMMESQAAASAENKGSLTLLSFVLGLVVFLLVQGWPLVTRGQTVGKMLFKLRIVRTDGTKPDAWRLLGLRYGVGMLTNLNPIVAMVYGILDCLLIFRESRKCLHDSIADTQVIKL